MIGNDPALLTTILNASYRSERHIKTHDGVNIFGAAKYRIIAQLCDQCPKGWIIAA